MSKEEKTEGKKIRFTLGGKLCTLSRQDIISVVENHDFPYDKYVGKGNQTYYIEVERKKRPVKWVISEVTGVRLGAFVTNTAEWHLRRLGFKIKDDWQKYDEVAIG